MRLALILTARFMGRGHRCGSLHCCLLYVRLSHSSSIPVSSTKSSMLFGVFFLISALLLLRMFQCAMAQQIKKCFFFYIASTDGIWFYAQFVQMFVLLTMSCNQCGQKLQLTSAQPEQVLCHFRAYFCILVCLFWSYRTTQIMPRL